MKDLEGLTPFDLYNSTVSGTNPKYDPQIGGSDVLAWGANRNYTLGLGDGNDRALPERIKLVRSDGGGSSTAPSGDSFDESIDFASAAKLGGKIPGSRFDRIRVKDVGMSKMHTILLTAEKSSNIWVCGIGSNGRLGGSNGVQTNFEPLKDFSETAQSISVAQDHTLIVTTSGAVYSFGLNRFSQLGYPLEEGLGIVAASNAASKGGGAASATFGAAPSSRAQAAELDTQISPRKLAGPLKKENVLGVAASKMHSAAFTSEGLYTWGTNIGQLGYDRGATPVQVVPRKVTTISQEIKQIAATDFATACLFTNWDVIVLHNDTMHRVQFPLNRFRSGISANIFRPQQAHPKPVIKKITSSGTTFGVISDTDLYTFSLDHPSEYSKSGSGSSLKTITPKPQLVWSMRKKFTAVRDVAIASDGSVILCTESGHVFVRAKRTASGPGGSAATPAGKYTPAVGGKASGKGGFKFQAIPYLQRVVKVAMNESGGFAAIKADATCREIKIRGRSLEEALQNQLPHLRSYPPGDAVEGVSIAADIFDVTAIPVDEEETDGDSDDDDDGRDSTARYVKMAQLLAESVRRWDNPAESGAPVFGPGNLRPPNGCDMFFVAGGKYVPAHRIIVASRIPSLASALGSQGAKGDSPPGIGVKRPIPGITVVTLPSCSFHTALFLLHFLYTDDLPPVWTASVGMQIERQFSALRINRTQVLSQMQNLASLLQLTTLMPLLYSSVPRAPAPSLRKDLQAAFKKYVDVEPAASAIHDVHLHFKDRTVPAHSVVLRRSPFFTSLFHPAFSALRWQDGIIEVDMKHLEWRPARVVLQHLYIDSGTDVFRGQDKGITQEDFIDLVIDVLAAADNLLLEKLSLSCSAILRRRIYSRNIASILTEADFYHASALKEACMDLCARSMETLLEGGLLDDLEHKVLKDLGEHVQQRQDDRLHRLDAASRLEALMVVHADYLADLDIPKPSLNLVSQRTPRRVARSPAMLPVDARRRPRFSGSPAASPEVKAKIGLPNVPDSGMLFDMDEDEPGLSAAATSPTPVGAMQNAMSELRLSGAKKSATPWAAMSKPVQQAASSSGSTTPAADLRSIMAAEQKRTPGSSAQASGTATPISSAPLTSTALSNSLGAKLSQRERKRGPMQQGSEVLSGTATWGEVPAAPKGSPWQTVPAKAVSIASSWKNAGDSAGPSSSPFGTSPRSPAHTQATPSPGLRAVSGTVTPSPFSLNRQESNMGSPSPSFGPSHTPTRSKASIVRRNGSDSSSAVWTATPSPSALAFPRQAPSTPTSMAANTPSNLSASMSPTRSALAGANSSFLAIQEQQKREDNAAQAALAAAASRRSFAEILEEERAAGIRAAEERKEREEFEKWFEAESRKLQQQEKGKGRAKNPRKKGASTADDQRKGEKAGTPSTEAQENPAAHEVAAASSSSRGRGRGGGGRARGAGRGGGGRGRGRESLPVPSQTGSAPDSKQTHSEA